MNIGRKINILSIYCVNLTPNRWSGVSSRWRLVIICNFCIRLPVRQLLQRLDATLHSWLPSRTTESSFLQYQRSDSNFVYCHNMKDSLKELGILIYNTTEWWLNIDSSKRRLRVYPCSTSIMAIYMVQFQLDIVCLNEEYGNRVIALLKYHQHNWDKCQPPVVKRIVSPPCVPQLVASGA